MERLTERIFWYNIHILCGHKVSHWTSGGTCEERYRHIDIQTFRFITLKKAGWVNIRFAQGYIITVLFYICLYAHNSQKITTRLFSPNQPYWADSVIESPFPSVVLDVCLCHWVQIVLGLSLALRSSNLFQDSHWSPPQKKNHPSTPFFSSFPLHFFGPPPK